MSALFLAAIARAVTNRYKAGRRGGSVLGAMMNVEKFKQAVVTKVYHIPAERKVPLHQHPKHDEVFYCVSGSGFGVLADREVELTPGKAFIVPAKILHALRTDGNLYVTSCLIPLADDPAYAE